ncbi:hypothetical protein PIB30_050042 [Stylosanthes scabra]|uniref:Uncharacterized protein n=1 Tax=Stylosanthes scabra TaxID=79078 RepID=A0ABU6ZGC2_9FABA|nr:hypothetical protein [Stylosanthes scabra]
MTSASDANRRMQRKKNQVARQVAAENKGLSPDPPVPGRRKTKKFDFESSKKRKNPPNNSFGSIFSNEFDVVGFLDEYMMKNSHEAMDVIGLKNNLEFVMKDRVRSVGIARAILKRLFEAPPTLAFELVALKQKISSLEAKKSDTNLKLDTLQGDVLKYQRISQEAEQSREACRVF